ncbi:serine protease easter-like [Condylostylus longicornis]|uniref:serine protease easter-like n=1 Tax=Condylostylus longicornis TaxID=2530218 RepID=UPI00244DB29E|nr:serine protease easter-like [Condylostylus longicornis]
MTKICPENQICVPVEHCSSVNNTLYKRDLNESEINYLRNLECDFKKTIYVCCNSSLPKPGECGRISISTKIINGHDTYLGQFPWVVLLGRRWREKDNKTGISYECAGSIINDPIEIVKIGEWNIETDPDIDRDVIGDPVIKAEVEKIIPHKEHRWNKRYDDIALIKLKMKINYTEFIKPICLPHKEEVLDGKLVIVGWGESGKKIKNNENSEDILEKIQQHASLDVVDNNECRKKYLRYNLKSTQMCAASAFSDSCKGDSGGPLIGLQTNHFPFYYFITGIVSFGKHCGTLGEPGVYTDVRKYIDWIQQNIIH